jgi:TPR repeat protein
MAALERKDYSTALGKFRSAAMSGNRDAQTYLGMMYDQGQGVAQDYKEAVRWYQLAAKQGDAVAQYNLGNMYSTGQGVLQDYVRAHMWSNIVAVSGAKHSIEYRDKIASRMTPQQIEQAQRMARECMASNFTKCD